MGRLQLCLYHHHGNDATMLAQYRVQDSFSHFCLVRVKRFPQDVSRETGNLSRGVFHWQSGEKDVLEGGW